MAFARLNQSTNDDVAGRLRGKLALWTQSELDAARRLYKKAGLRVASKQPHDSFGRKGLVAETWEMKL